jgi:hypothetical protein
LNINVKKNFNKIFFQSQGNLHEAQRLYEKAILKQEETELDRESFEQHNLQCFAGISRTSIKLGDVSRGYQIAQELKDHQVINKKEFIKNKILAHTEEEKK